MNGVAFVNDDTCPGEQISSGVPKGPAELRCYSPWAASSATSFTSLISVWNLRAIHDPVKSLMTAQWRAENSQIFMR